MRAIESRGDRQLSREKSSGTGRVDHKAGAQRQDSALMPPREHDRLTCEHGMCQLYLLTIIHPCRDGFANEVMIHIGTQPVGIGDCVVRARGDEQSFRVVSAVAEWLVGMVPVEGEAALESASHIRMVREPATMGGQVPAICQAISPRETLQREIRQWCGRLPDGEAWMSTALEQHHMVAEYGEHSGEEGSGEAAADYGDLTGLHHSPPHASHSTRGSPRPVTLRRVSRAMRALLHCGQV